MRRTKKEYTYKANNYGYNSVPFSETDVWKLDKKKKRTKKASFAESQILKKSFSIQEQIQKRVEQESLAMWARTQLEKHEIKDIKVEKEIWSVGWSNFFRQLRP